MNPNRVLEPLAIVLALGLSSTGTYAAGVSRSSEDGNGLTVLARGPVHEAFAQPTNPRPDPSALVPRQPPAPLPEVAPEDQPRGKEVQWVPGYWDWDEEKTDFLWVSGLWRVPPPERKWVPGYWSQSADSWQWVSGFWAPTDQKQVQYLNPPPDLVDNGPGSTAPPAGGAYVPGNWFFRDNRYVWRPGYWCAFQPGWVWQPGYYLWTPAGYVFVEGYWDYCLEDRGLLYAPVYFDQPFSAQPNWCYTPSYGVNLSTLIDSLFFRPRCSSYCFGNYYSASCRTRGYRPWCYHGPVCFDPLFIHCAWINRGNRLWERGLCDRFRARFQGTAIVPAVTLRQQTTLLRQTALLNAANAQNLNLVSSLQQQRDNKLVMKVPPAQLDQQRTSQNHFQQVMLARNLAEQTGAHFSTSVSPSNRGLVVHTFRLPAYPAVRNTASNSTVTPGPSAPAAVRSAQPVTPSNASASVSVPRMPAAPPAQPPRSATPASPPRIVVPSQPRTILPSLIQAIRPAATVAPRPSTPPTPPQTGKPGK